MPRNKGKGRLAAAIAPAAQPSPVAQLTITAYDNHPPTLQCSGDAVTALRLLSAGAAMVANSLEKSSPQLPAEDKHRKFLGPREG